MNVQFQCPSYTGPPVYGPTQVHADKGDGTPACGQTCPPMVVNGVKHPSVPTSVSAPVTCERKGCLG